MNTTPNTGDNLLEKTVLTAQNPHDTLLDLALQAMKTMGIAGHHEKRWSSLAVRQAFRQECLKCGMSPDETFDLPMAIEHLPSSIKTAMESALRPKAAVSETKPAAVSPTDNKQGKQKADKPLPDASGGELA